MANNTNSQIGAGFTLSLGSGSPVTYATLGPTRSISGIGVTPSEVDSTTLDSTAIERIGGLPDGKPVTIVFAAGSAIATTVEGLVNTGTAFRLRLTAPAPFSGSRYFNLAAPGFEYGQIAPNGLVELTLTGRISGGISAVA